MRPWSLLAPTLLFLACSESGESKDAGLPDAGATLADAAPTDATPTDASPRDTGVADAVIVVDSGEGIPTDASVPDADPVDSGVEQPPTTAEAQLLAGEASAMVATTESVQRAILTVVADGELLDAIPIGRAFTSAHCDLLQSQTFGKCPAYGLSCNNASEIQGVTMTFDAGGCGVCKKGGHEISGTVVISRVGVGTYDVQFQAYKSGDVTLDGTLEAEIIRGGDGSTFELRTPDGPLAVTREGATTHLRLDPVLITHDLQAELPWVITVHANIEGSDGHTFTLATENAAGDSDPLAFDGPVEACFGPTQGSLKATIVRGGVSVYALATFGDPAGNPVICSRPKGEAGSSQDFGSAFDAVKASLTRALENVGGNVSASDFASVPGVERAINPWVTKAARALAQIVEMGEIRNALENGWTALVCDDTVQLACSSGTGSTHVTCSNRVVRGMDVTMSACSLDGVVYDGSFTLNRDTTSALPRGNASFVAFAVDADRIQGDLSFVQRSADPLEVEIAAGPAGFEVWEGGTAECAYSTLFEKFRIVRATDSTEIELSMQKETNEGIYGITTQPAPTRHLVWNRPATCTCPNPGSTVDIKSPDLLGKVGGQSTLRIVYGQATPTHCASAAVSFLEWPCSRPPERGGCTVADDTRKQAAILALQPLVEAACVAP